MFISLLLVLISSIHRWFCQQLNMIYYSPTRTLACALAVQHCTLLTLFCIGISCDFLLCGSIFVILLSILLLHTYTKEDGRSPQYLPLSVYVCVCVCMYVVHLFEIPQMFRMKYLLH